MFILEPTPVALGLARKKVDVCEYPDGRLEIQHEGEALPYRIFDKMRRVNQASVVDNKHLDAALALAHAIQQVQPHHAKRNNHEPAQVRSNPTDCHRGPRRRPRCHTVHGEASRPTHLLSSRIRPCHVSRKRSYFGNERGFPLLQKPYSASNVMEVLSRTKRG